VAERRFVEELDGCFVSCATKTGKRSRISISRMSRAGERQRSCSARMRRGENLLKAVLWVYVYRLRKAPPEIAALIDSNLIR
jgi:hypothetical protein